MHLLVFLYLEFAQSIIIELFLPPFCYSMHYMIFNRWHTTAYLYIIAI